MVYIMSKAEYCACGERFRFSHETRSMEYDENIDEHYSVRHVYWRCLKWGTKEIHYGRMYRYVNGRPVYDIDIVNHGN